MNPVRRPSWQPLAVALIASGCVWVLSGCSDNYDPAPYERMGQVGETLEAIRDSEYGKAATLFRKMLKEDPNNPFLLETERRMDANAALHEAEKLMRAGHLEEARAIIRKEIRANGSTPILTKSLRTFDDLIVVKTLSDESKRASTAEALGEIANRIKITRETHDELAPMLLPLLQRTLILRRQIESEEASKARLDMLCDLDYAMTHERTRVPQMLAELAIAAPHLRAEKHYPAEQIRSILTP